MITYPAFIDGYFKTTMDGEIHFIKMDAIATTLKSGSWRVWIISAFIVLILLSSWIPYSDS